MEYKFFLSHIAKYMPDGFLLENKIFTKYIIDQKFEQMFQIADFLMVTLPKPRINYYKQSDFFKI